MRPAPGRRGTVRSRGARPDHFVASEWDVAVVPAAAAELAQVIGAHRRALVVGRALGPRPAARPAATAHEAHVLAHDLRGPALLAVLVLPLARAERALDQHLATLGEVLLGEVGLLAEQHHAVPLGLVLPTAAAVGPALVGREVERGHRGPALRVADLGIPAEAAEEDDPVETHGRLLFWGAPWTGAGGVDGHSIEVRAVGWKRVVLPFRAFRARATMS